MKTPRNQGLTVSRWWYSAVCGGCRARAYAATGDPLAEEPDCAYEPVGMLAGTR